MNQAPAYGLWSLAVINAAVFILFALSFAKPATGRGWRAFGAFSAFVVALFAEMYGFPLTIYLLSGWLQTRLPGIDLLGHDSGHLLEQLFGWRANPHFGPFHIVSTILLAEVAALANLYQDMVQDPAWIHFHGRMESLRRRMELGLRRGDRSPLGIDLSDTYRVTITILENLISYPDMVQSRLELLERQTGISKGKSKFDNLTRII